MTLAQKLFHRRISNNCTNCSNLTVEMQKNQLQKICIKCYFLHICGKTVEGESSHKKKTLMKRSCQSFSSAIDTDMTQCFKKRLY